jgi:sugar phosphate isomerase/epimerase
MRISISNIAWDPKEDAAVAKVLNAHGVDAIDVAPGKYFLDFASATAEDISACRRWWSDRGIKIVGMQSLLFGTQGLNLFGDAGVQDRMLAYLAHVCRIGGDLGARYLVFGSPRNRDRSGLEDGEVNDMAVSFFRRLGDIAAATGTCICLEPNPVEYGANFMTDAAATAEIVRLTDHPAIRMQLDVGSLTLNHEDPEQVLADYAPIIAHVHASEPGLKVLGDGDTNHDAVATAVRRYCPDRIVTIEMLEVGEASVANVERAVAYTNASYGQAGTP